MIDKNAFSPTFEAELNSWKKSLALGETQERVPLEEVHPLGEHGVRVIGLT